MKLGRQCIVSPLLSGSRHACRGASTFAIALALLLGVPLLAHVGSAAAQTRDPLQSPFATTSIWNMPIGGNAVYVPANMPLIAYNVNEWAPMPVVDW